MKRKISLSNSMQILALASLGSACGGDYVDGYAEAELGADRAPVELVWADTYGTGCSSCVSGRGFIEVANIAYEKRVVLKYSSDGGDWREHWAFYARSIDDDRELWFFDHLTVLSPTRFAIQYDVGNRTYWDNNGRHDYLLHAESVRGRGAETVMAQLGPSRDIAVVRSFVTALDGGDLTVDIHVRNLAYRKNVFLHVTFDGWKTVETRVGTHDFQFDQDFEKWQVRQPVPLGATEIQFAAAVEMGGERFWDNGYGKNFKCEKRENRLFQDWLCSGMSLP